MARQADALSRRRLLAFAATASAALLSGCAAFDSAAPTPFQFLDPQLPTPSPARQAAVRGVLEEVLREVRTRFRYASDESVYGIHERWALPGEASDWRGDCEDFALLCREYLRARDIRNSVLVTCWTEEGQYHCVLYVDGWMLDNRFDYVLSNTDLWQLGYRWHKAGLESGEWYYIESTSA